MFYDWQGNFRVVPHQIQIVVFAEYRYDTIANRYGIGGIGSV